jgi:stage IV sporulation protein FA
MKSRDDRKKRRLEAEEAMFREAALLERYAEEDGQPLAELDPEVAWKLNPNPWANWGEESEAPRRSFVRAADPTRYAPVDGPGGGYSFGRSFIRKLAVALLVFGAIWGLFRLDEPWALQGQAFVKQALTDELDFAAAAAWYKEAFAGAPSFIPIFQNAAEEATSAEGTVKLPVVNPLPDSSLVQTFAELLNGVELAGVSAQEVAAVETGRVQTTAGQAESGLTVLIQHANGRVTIYGGLAETSVKTGDWVEAGEAIGRLPETEGNEPSLLYFAVKQNDLYVDPVGVIPFD